MNAYPLLSRYLTLLKVKHTSELKKVCLKLPFMDTLYGYSSLLKKYNVDNLVFDMTDEKKNLMSCRLPAIVPFGEGFVIVYRISDTFIYYWEDGRRCSSSLDDFFQKWSGVVLLAETTKSSIEPDYMRHLISEYLKKSCLSLLLFAVGFWICGLIAKQAPYSPVILVSVLLNILGAYVSFLLYQKDFRLSHSYVDKICTYIKSGSCDNVINSPEGKFLGVVSWSLVGLGYFMSNIFLLISYPQYYIFFYCVSILVLPYSFWSIWCQKVKLKQWCVLCLVVQALLWLIFLNNLVFFHDKLSFPTDVWPWLITFVIYSLPFSLLFLYTLKRKERQEMRGAYRRFLELKYDEELFKYSLYKSNKYLDYREVSSVFVGNKNAKVVITLITNLFCTPCAYMHSRIKALEGQLEEDVCLQYIFLSPTEEIEKYSKGLISLYKRKGESEFSQSLDRWFKNDRTDIDNEINSKSYNQECDSESEYIKHKSFIERYDIHRTPTILINGCVLPDFYEVEDLIYML